MSEFKKAEKDLASAEQILLPNRYEDAFVEAYQELTGLEVPKADERRLKATSNGLTYRWIRGRDITPTIVKLSREKPGLRVSGLTGYEWWREFVAVERNRCKTATSVASNKLIGRVSLIASAESAKAVTQRRSNQSRIQVVTAYPNLARKLGFGVKQAVSGCVEGVADSLDLPALDLVCSGQTIKKNGFVEIEPLLDSFPVVVSTLSPSGRMEER